MTAQETFSPIADRVVLKPIDPDQMTASGLVLVGRLEDEWNLAEVIAVGPGRTENGVRIPMQVQVGQKVLYGKFHAVESRLDRERYVIVRENDLLSIVNGR